MFDKRIGFCLILLRQLGRVVYREVLGRRVRLENEGRIKCHYVVHFGVILKNLLV